jgi:hypothetical protein
VQNVAHGAQPDHKHAIVGLRLQVLIFSQGRLMRNHCDPVHQPVDGGGLVFDLDV